MQKIAKVLVLRSLVKHTHYWWGRRHPPRFNYVARYPLSRIALPRQKQYVAPGV